jgi:hypothetical protein
MKRTSNSYSLVLIVTAMVLLMGTVSSSCNLIPISESEAAKLTEIRSTELEVNVKQTLLALQEANRNAIQTAVLETSRAQSVTSATTPVEPPPATPAIAQITPEQPTEPPPTSSATPEPFDEDAFRQWSKTAKILLYEDMTSRLDTVRYVKSTLDDMGLAYKDDGSAYGWMLDDLKNGPQSGGEWDLIIIATEDKKGIQGDFFGSVVNSVDQGTSVIYELWYLDSTYRANASGLLSSCGIEFENDWVRIQPSRAAMFILNPDNPILNQPNQSLNFSSTTSYWWDPNGVINYDIGDLVKTMPGSGATLLVGTNSGSKTSHGTVTVCMDGKLILQTFSSHVLTFNSMAPVWENYIFNALRTRYININQ